VTIFKKKRSRENLEIAVGLAETGLKVARAKKAETLREYTRRGDKTEAPTIIRKLVGELQADIDIAEEVVTQALVDLKEYHTMVVEKELRDLPEKLQAYNSLRKKLLFDAGENIGRSLKILGNLGPDGKTLADHIGEAVNKSAHEPGSGEIRIGKVEGFNGMEEKNLHAESQELRVLRGAAIDTSQKNERINKFFNASLRQIRNG